MEILDGIPYMESERLVLKRPDASHTADVFALRDDRQVYRYLPGFLVEQLYSDPVAAAIYVSSYQVEVLGIFLKSNPDRLIGLVELYDFDLKGGMVSVGYRLRSAFWGRGIASESVGLVLSYLAAHTPIHLVKGHVMVENKGSMHVLEKNGFTSDYRSFEEDWAREKPAVVYEFTRHI